jgi:hypothetical protein
MHTPPTHSCNVAIPYVSQAEAEQRAAEEAAAAAAAAAEHEESASSSTSSSDGEDAIHAVDLQVVHICCSASLG